MEKLAEKKETERADHLIIYKRTCTFKPPFYHPQNMRAIVRKIKF